jgi:cytochrome c oxidase cbb3-type subunit 2
MWKFHRWFERNSLVLLIGVVVVIAIGGIVEITPLFYLESTIEKVQGIRPYTPLELEGRDIYSAEGCEGCHSQMIRPLRDEVERYGHYSLAAESMYDHPFLWGAHRTGPDLARVGGKYSDGWQRDHLVNPRAVVPESVMPPYGFLMTEDLDYHDVADKLRALQTLGVPYTQADIDNAAADLRTQASSDADAADLHRRYGARVNQRDFAGVPGRITKMDALIAYLQMLGTTVDFSTYHAGGDNDR